jgi:hypothetical protein
MLTATMRRSAVPLLLALSACGSLGRAPVDLTSVRARDFAWLAGTWRGASEEGVIREQTFTEPVEGTMLGEYRSVRDGEVIARSEMRLISGTGGLVLVGSLEGSGPRNYALVEFGRQRARFRSPRADFPAEVVYERAGDTLSLRIRGASGLGTVTELLANLERVR